MSAIHLIEVIREQKAESSRQSKVGSIVGAGLAPAQNTANNEGTGSPEAEGVPLAGTQKTQRPGSPDKIEDSRFTIHDSRLIMALLPGSRKQEILKKLPVMLEVANRLPQYQFVVAKAPGQEDAFFMNPYYSLTKTYRP